jgi:hypothetical protein
MFGLREYVAESLLSVTALLLDRSSAIRGCVGNNFFCYLQRTPIVVSEPDLCVVCLYG